LAVPRYIVGMCGRAAYKLTWEEIVALYRLTLGQPAVNTRAQTRPAGMIENRYARRRGNFDATIGLFNSNAWIRLGGF
jgi:hypothetical protein